MNRQFGEEELSRLIYTTLDTVGFQRECVTFRSKAQTKINESLNSNFAKYEIPLTHLFVGSTSEGTALGNSDTDFMTVIPDSVCVDKANTSGYFNFFEADYTNTAPGYTKVVIANLDEESPFQIFFDDSQMYKSSAGRAYISSTIFRNFHYQIAQAIPVSAYFHQSNENDCTKTSGPATTLQIGYALNVDNVFSVYFYGSSHLRSWAVRLRSCKWPSADLIREISQMEGYIVPVGNKFSDTQNIEWRICYTTAEMKLVESLNDVQVKLYILLKMVATKMIRPLYKEMTSYVVKNVIFWVSETQHEQQFRPNLLVDLLWKSLIFIKYCLENNHFPNYMISERNMLGNAVDCKEKQHTIRFLSECLEKGGSIILMIPELQECMNRILKVPNLVLYRDWRNQVEQLLIASAIYKSDHFDLGMLSKSTLFGDLEWEYFKDERYLDTWIKLFSLVVPEWMGLILTGKIGEMIELFFKRLQAMPSL
ncbi:uncharacterized protein LOC123524772 [Mercenaria mercenaria]|uniref:uncharacterized protein LOC123524772 n=1 Tax=Mercenaria mercenaria TaxID=6596 RepID=UPI001E1D3867|nr:uncharacterized protein LOC123524772 [Mercenaria mercenaria]XP_045159170.1 uncharacterized protein LOC123524772 [Mercenaria mercenaria]